MPYITNPKQLQLAIVNRVGANIRFIHNPTEEVQLAAVKESKRSIKFIDNPSEKVKAVHLALWVL